MRYAYNAKQTKRNRMASNAVRKCSTAKPNGIRKQALTETAILLRSRRVEKCFAASKYYYLRKGVATTNIL